MDFFYEYQVFIAIPYILFHSCLKFYLFKLTCCNVFQGLVALTGVSVPVTIYSWVVILVLPINAVVDPLLYSLSTKLHKKVTLRKLAHAIYRDFLKKQTLKISLEKMLIFLIFCPKHRLWVHVRTA